MEPETVRGVKNKMSGEHGVANAQTKKSKTEFYDVCDLVKFLIEKEDKMRRERFVNVGKWKSKYNEVKQELDQLKKLMADKSQNVDSKVVQTEKVDRGPNKAYPIPGHSGLPYQSGFPRPSMVGRRNFALKYKPQPNRVNVVGKKMNNNTVARRARAMPQTILDSIDLTVDDDSDEEEEERGAGTDAKTAEEGGCIPYLVVETVQDDGGENQQREQPKVDYFATQMARVTPINKPAAAVAASSSSSGLGGNKTWTYPPCFPRVPPHKSQPFWKNVPAAPRFEVVRVAGNSARLIWYYTPVQGTAETSVYELYIYHKTDERPDVSMWEKADDIRATTTMPIACEILELISGHTYYFILRAVDVYGRRGPFNLHQITV